METLERILSDHPFFSGFAEHHLELVTGCASNVRFDEGAYLFHQGEAASRFYLIRHGRVAIELPTPVGGSRIVQTLEAGDIIGWSWLVPPYQWRFDGRAVELTRAIAIDGECIRRKCESDHELGYAVLKRLSGLIAERLDATRLQLLDFYGNPS